MSPLDAAYLSLLCNNLKDKYVAHLPKLLREDKPKEELEKKNLSRAFSAFALHHLSFVPEDKAAQAVVDDFDDVGLDAIYYDAGADTLYLVQSKLKASEQFSQNEALAFCQGVRKLIQQDFSGFNEHVKRRQVEIEDALDCCSSIQLVIAHTGSGISEHAKTAVGELLSDESHGEERFKKDVIYFDAGRVTAGLQLSKAYPRIDASIIIRKCSLVNGPNVTYVGLASLTDLIALHKKHDSSLYQKNIRTFLGHDTAVNKAIQRTLAEKPDHFLYLNNGVTVLCHKIDPKGNKSDGKRLDIKGFSVVNGAQTIASAARFVSDNPGANIERSRVSITLIQADSDGEFGKSVTQARNHQNQVVLSNFVALDDEQERLRCDLAHLGIHYAYKAGSIDNPADPKCIRADEAAHSLALFASDPRYIVWLKKEPATLLDTSSSRYKALFTPKLTAFQLVNAVLFTRYVEKRMLPEARGCGPERLTYKHGIFLFGWALAKRVQQERDGVILFDPAKLESLLSASADALRLILWNKIQPALGNKSPLSVLRNQTFALPLCVDVLVEHYNLSADLAVAALKGRQDPGDLYPVKLFDYLISKAPQIGNLT